MMKHINWNISAEVILDQIKDDDASITIRKNNNYTTVHIVDAKPVNMRTDCFGNKAIVVPGKNLFMPTGSHFFLSIDKVRIEGKPTMKINDFLKYFKLSSVCEIF